MLTKLINSFITIGWILDELSKLRGFGTPGMAIFDDTRHQESSYYYLLYQKFPPLFVNDLENLQPQGINVIITNNVEPLRNLTREEGFFKQSCSYIFVTAINEMEIDAVFWEIYNKFKAFALFAVNYNNNDVFFFEVALNATVIHKPDQLVMPPSVYGRKPNFEGSPFRIVYFRRQESFLVDEQDMNIIGGQDGLAMKTIAEEFNATVELVETSDGRRYGQLGPNGTIQGAFTNLLQGTAHITGNTHFMRSYGPDGLQFTHYLSSDRLCLLVPKPKKIPNYVALYRQVQYRWFYMYTASCIFGLMTLRRVENLLLAGRSGMNMNIMISVVFRIFFGVPVLYQFRRLHEKIIISSFLLATVVLSNYFQCMMTTIASSPSYEKTMNTLADVKDRGVPIYYSNKDVKSYLSNDDLKGLNFIEVSVEESIAAAKRSDTGRTHRTYSVFTKKNMYYKGVKATKSMLIVPDCLADYPLAFVMPKGVSLLEPVNGVLSKLVESGLYLKWTKDSVPGNTYVQRNKKEVSLPDPVKNVELYYAYTLLGIGLSLSSFFFLAEKIMYKTTPETPIDDQINSKKHFRFIQ